MFNTIDDYARRTATKLSNWVLHLPFWPEGLVGERLLRYSLLGLLALGHVLFLSSYWGMSGSAVYLGIFGVAATAMDAYLLHAIYKNRPLRMASYIDVRLMWLFIGIFSVSLVLVSAVQGYFEFQGGMFAWWLLYELEDVKPPRKKRPRKDSAGKPSFGTPWNVSHNLWR